MKRKPVTLDEWREANRPPHPLSPEQIRTVAGILRRVQARMAEEESSARKGP